LSKVGREHDRRGLSHQYPESRSDRPVDRTADAHSADALLPLVFTRTACRQHHQPHRAGPAGRTGGQTSGRGHTFSTGPRPRRRDVHVPSRTRTTGRRSRPAQHGHDQGDPGSGRAMAALAAGSVDVIQDGLDDDPAARRPACGSRPCRRIFPRNRHRRSGRANSYQRSGCRDTQALNYAVDRGRIVSHFSGSTRCDPEQLALPRMTDTTKMSVSVRSGPGQAVARRRRSSNGFSMAGPDHDVFQHQPRHRRHRRRSRAVGSGWT